MLEIVAPPAGLPPRIAAARLAAAHGAQGDATPSYLSSNGCLMSVSTVQYVAI